MHFLRVVSVKKILIIDVMLLIILMTLSSFLRQWCHFERDLRCWGGDKSFLLTLPSYSFIINHHRRVLNISHFKSSLRGTDPVWFPTSIFPPLPDHIVWCADCTWIIGNNKMPIVTGWATEDHWTERRYRQTSTDSGLTVVVMITFCFM